MAVSKTPAAPSSFVKDLFKVEKDMTALTKSRRKPSKRGNRRTQSSTIQNHMRAAYRGLNTTMILLLASKSLAIAKNAEELRPEMELISKTTLPDLSENSNKRELPIF